LVLLIAHVLVHPLVHESCEIFAPTHATVATDARGSGASGNSLESCDLCRAGHNTMLWAGLPKAERFNPQWIPLRLQAVSYASLRIERQLPARAPPSL
jgi:hypothetical protein